MSLGHRTYIIEGDSVSPLAQKTFDDFFFDERPALGAYSGRTLTFAMPMYELENRRPAEAAVARQRRSPPISEEAQKKILARLGIQ